MRKIREHTVVTAVVDIASINPNEPITQQIMIAEHKYEAT